MNDELCERCVEGVERIEAAIPRWFGLGFARAAEKAAARRGDELTQAVDAHAVAAHQCFGERIRQKIFESGLDAAFGIHLATRRSTTRC